MFFSALMITLFAREQKQIKNIVRNLSTGSFWAVANISLFYAASKLGLGLSYTVSQLCIVVSIIGGVFILKERKTKNQTLQLIGGTLLFLLSTFILSLFQQIS